MIVEERAMRWIITLAAAATLLSAPALAGAPCRDAKGKFTKCPEAKPAAGTKCKDAKGKFAKCGTPGAKPI
jgi:hypothetical protein